MPNGNRQKIKLLKLMEMLYQQTDEEHPLTTSQLMKRLNDLGISCDRRTLGNDIATLNEYGYEVLSCYVGHEKAYYVVDRTFTIPELKILIDAVQDKFGEGTKMIRTSRVNAQLRSRCRSHRPSGAGSFSSSGR